MKRHPRGHIYSWHAEHLIRCAEASTVACSLGSCPSNPCPPSMAALALTSLLDAHDGKPHCHPSHLTYNHVLIMTPIILPYWWPEYCLSLDPVVHQQQLCEVAISPVLYLADLLNSWCCHVSCEKLLSVIISLCLKMNLRLLFGIYRKWIAGVKFHFSCSALNNFLLE
jgi:hypothetical protein